MQDRRPGMERSVVPELSWLEATAALTEQSDKEEPMVGHARWVRDRGNDTASPTVQGADGRPE